MYNLINMQEIMKEALKELWRGASGVFVLMFGVMCVFGVITVLLLDGYYVFAAAEVVVLGFAYQPIRNYLEKTLFQKR